MSLFFVQITPKYLSDTQKSVVFCCYINVYPHSKILYRHTVICRVSSVCLACKPMCILF